uniref:Uncharacterized protein n=1 Tax=Romanomermis culicivorax TaxID=13658 RepID=A0A915JGX5_ROMCU
MRRGANLPRREENPDDLLINEPNHVNVDHFNNVIINGIGQGFAEIEDPLPMFENMDVDADINIGQI